MLQLSNDAGEFDEDQCLDLLVRIINSCDGNGPENPPKFKFGGEYKRSTNTYSITPKKDRGLVKHTDGPL